LPHEDGDLSKPEIDLYRFVASDIFIDGHSNNEYTIFKDDTSLVFNKVDGVDTLYMEKGAELEVRGVEETDGLTKIVLKDVKYSEVGFSEDDGELSVADQFGSASPRRSSNKKFD